MVRVVVLDRETGETVHRGHRRREPGRDLRPRPPRARLRGAHRLRSSATSSPRSTTRPIPTSTASPGTTRASSTSGARDRRFSRTGTRPRRPDHGRRRAARPRAGRGVPGGARRSTRAEWDVRFPLRRAPSGARARPARGGVDERRRRRGRPAGRGGGQRRRHAERRRARRAARLLLDRLRLRRHEGRAVRRVRLAPTRSAPTAARSCTARQPPATRRGSSARRGSSGRPATTSSARCSGSAPSATRCAVVDDQRGCPTYTGHLAAAVPAVVDAALRRLPRRRRPATAPGRSFAEAIFEEAGLDCRVRPDHDGRVRRKGAAGPPTRCCAPRRARPSCRTGATACASVSAASAERSARRPARARVPALLRRTDGVGDRRRDASDRALVRRPRSDGVGHGRRARDRGVAGAARAHGDRRGCRRGPRLAPAVDGCRRPRSDGRARGHGCAARVRRCDALGADRAPGRLGRGRGVLLPGAHRPAAADGLRRAPPARERAPRPFGLDGEDRRAGGRRDPRRRSRPGMGPRVDAATFGVSAVSLALLHLPAHVPPIPSASS